MVRLAGDVVFRFVSLSDLITMRRAARGGQTMDHRRADELESLASA